MADTAEYTATDRAGKRVAGRIVPPDRILHLTEDEAEHELREGTIVPKGKDLHKAFTEDTRASTKTRAAAEAGLPAPEAGDTPPEGDGAGGSAPDGGGKPARALKAG